MATLQNVATAENYVSYLKDYVNGLRSYAAAFKWYEAPQTGDRVSQFRSGITKLGNFWSNRSAAQQTAFNNLLTNRGYDSAEFDAARNSLVNTIGPDLDAVSTALTNVKAQSNFDSATYSALSTAMNTLITDINAIVLVTTSLV